MKIFLLFFQFILSIIRMIFVGGITAVILLYTLDIFLDTDNGILNLIIILMTYSFFPLFFAILVEVFFAERRKHLSKKKSVKKLYRNN